MFLGAFERVFKELQKSGLNWSRPVNVNRFFCGLYILKIKRPDCRSGLLWSWSGLVTVFFWSRDWTSKHYFTALSEKVVLHHFFFLKCDVPKKDTSNSRNSRAQLSLIVIEISDHFT